MDRANAADPSVRLSARTDRFAGPAGQAAPDALPAGPDRSRRGHDAPLRPPVHPDASSSPRAASRRPSGLDTTLAARTDPTCAFGRDSPLGRYRR